MQTRSTAKFVAMSPRKVGLVAELIRGQKAGEALHLLAYTNKRAAQPVGKVLASAMANATNNHGARERDLVVSDVLVGAGPTLKRFRPRSKGMAHPVRHRTSHITVVVSDNQPAVAPKSPADKPSAETKPAVAKKEAK